ncbi:MAG: hypothetical protein OEY93_05265 [Anaerolineae bacterium]|nr:hypothetical protein [Anaerolineae bacterium]
MRSRTTLGILLIIGGILSLLQTLNILQGQLSDTIWGVLFGAAGLYFILMFVRNSGTWWPIIPGAILLSLAVVSLSSLFLGGVLSDIEGLIILGSLGLSFLLIFLTNRVQWWAVIPGGVLLTVGVISWIDETGAAGVGSETVLFLGLGLTFLLLYLVPTPVGRIGWAIFPAAALLLVGAFVGYADNEVVGKILGPAGILLAGLVLLVSSLRKG